MKTIRHILTMVGVLALALTTSKASEKKDLDQLRGEVPEAIAIFKAKDSTLARFFDKSQGYAVFPRVAKGGLVFGGAGGSGLVYEKGRLIGSAGLSQGTFGAQIGGQVFSEVIFFESAAALSAFKRSEFSITAQVSAVAAAEGVSQNVKFQNGVAIFTAVKTGLMAEASVGGQKFKYEPLPESK